MENQYFPEAAKELNVGTSRNAISLARKARKAKAPGRKETVIAASGVWPLLVLPMVSLILGKGLLWATVNRVRLETYNAELLELSIMNVGASINYSRGCQSREEVTCVQKTG